MVSEVVLEKNELSINARRCKVGFTSGRESKDGMKSDGGI